MRCVAWAGDWPITQGFGGNYDAYKQFGLLGHNGLDIGMWNGTELFAADDGVVQVSVDPTGYGNTVLLVADDGHQYRYGHMQNFAVGNGDRVRAGALIGHSNNTGNSSGPHLHFGVRAPGFNANDGYSGYSDPTTRIEELNEMQQELDQLRSDKQALTDKNAELEGTTSALQDMVNALHEEVRHLREDVIPSIEITGEGSDAFRDSLQKIADLATSTLQGG